MTNSSLKATLETYAHPFPFSMESYRYTETRAKFNAEEFLKGFKGYLMTDGYQGYNNLPNITREACWAHIRRKFCDAIPTGKKDDLSEPAVQGVQYCDKLFAIERYCRENSYTPEQRHSFRNKKVPKILEAFWVWLDKQNPTKGSRMDKAVTYARNQKPYAETYLQDGRCSLSNNPSLSEQITYPQLFPEHVDKKDSSVSKLRINLLPDTA